MEQCVCKKNTKNKILISRRVLWIPVLIPVKNYLKSHKIKKNSFSKNKFENSKKMFTLFSLKSTLFFTEFLLFLLVKKVLLCTLKLTKKI